MSKLFILLFGFLLGSLLFSGIPTGNVQLDRACFAFGQDSQIPSLPGDCEVLDMDKDENNNEEMFAESIDSENLSEEHVRYVSRNVVHFVNRHLLPDQYTNLPPPLRHIILYS